MQKTNICLKNILTIYNAQKVTYFPLKKSGISYMTTGTLYEVTGKLHDTETVKRLCEIYEIADRCFMDVSQKDNHADMTIFVKDSIDLEPFVFFL